MDQLYLIEYRPSKKIALYAYLKRHDFQFERKKPYPLLALRTSKERAKNLKNLEYIVKIWPDPDE